MIIQRNESYRLHSSVQNYFWLLEQQNLQSSKTQWHPIAYLTEFPPPQTNFLMEPVGGDLYCSCLGSFTWLYSSGGWKLVEQGGLMHMLVSLGSWLGSLSVPPQDPASRLGWIANMWAGALQRPSYNGKAHIKPACVIFSDFPLARESHKQSLTCLLICFILCLFFPQS